MQALLQGLEPFLQIFITVAVLLLVSVLSSKISDRFGIPALLLFLALGMLAGSEGPGGIFFDNYAVAQAVGTTALVFILFSGGLSTSWHDIRPVLREGVTLAVLGVISTAVAAGLFAHWVLGFSLAEGILLGSIVSSTDAAAVLSVLRARGVHLRPQLRSLLELESGSNDPTAIFLTLASIQLLQGNLTLLSLVGTFFLQMALGALLGYLFGRGTLRLINGIRLGYDGLYSVLMIAAVLLIYAVTQLVGGNGFLAVYLAGIVLANHDFIHKRSLLNFHDGVAWLMQIAMFLILGLLVFPHRLLIVAGPALLFAAFLMFIARPVSVFLGLTPFSINLRERTLLSWVGLRGAVPIVLATYPLLAGVPNAQFIFDIVFFVVLTSVLLQGTTITPVARWLGLEVPPLTPREHVLAQMPDSALRTRLRDLAIPAGAPSVGRALVDLHLPGGFLVVLIEREDESLLPSGSTVLQAGDRLLVLSEPEVFDPVADRLIGQRQPAPMTAEHI